jgi:hypothetical protein
MSKRGALWMRIKHGKTTTRNEKIFLKCCLLNKIAAQEEN